MAMPIDIRYAYRFELAIAIAMQTPNAADSLVSVHYINLYKIL